MDRINKVIIIGGVAGGAAAATRLRRLNEQAEIIIFERGGYVSFANCGLPYYIGGAIAKESELLLQTPEKFKNRYNIDVRILTEVLSINRLEKTVTVKNLSTGDTYTETYEKLILSMGAEPFIGGFMKGGSNRVFTLRSIPDANKIKVYINANSPKSAVIAGGGFIGVEMAENLRFAGVDVTICQRSGQVLTQFDYEMATIIHNHIKENGVKLLFNSGLTAVTEEKDGLTIETASGEIKADMLINALGVVPETGIAKEAGLPLNKKGAIVVNEQMLTTDNDIYAVGDAVETTDFLTGNKAYVPLAGPASKQGRIAADNVCGLGSGYKGAQHSFIIKVFDITAASTGINEKAAKLLNLNYEKSYTSSASHASYYKDASDMMIKIIFEKDTGKILGAQIVGGDGVDKRCDVIATAIRAGMTAYDLAELELCYAPPYSSAKDPVNMAGFVIENILSQVVKIFHYDEINKLQENKDALFIDVRTEQEFKLGTIDGFINIPLDTLRNSLHLLDKNKKIYVTCQVGFRGYHAARILCQNGYDAYNLSGGYSLYSAVNGNV